MPGFTIYQLFEFVCKMRIVILHRTVVGQERHHVYRVFYTGPGVQKVFNKWEALL